MNSIYASEQIKQDIWPDFIKHFRSKSSIASYKSDIGEYLGFIKKDFLLQNSKDADDFYNYLMKKYEDGKIQAATVAKKIWELHSFSDYIYENKDNFDIPDSFDDVFSPYLSKLAKVEKYAKSVPVDHIDKIMNAAQSDLMAYCILTLLYRVGLSSTEISELKLKHFESYENGVYLFLPNRKEPCYVPEDVYTILVRYITENGDNEYLFYNKWKKKLNPMYISRLNKKYAELAGVPAYSARELRNSCAFTMFAYNANANQVAKQMGVTQTMITRYKGIYYKENIIKNANQLIKLKVEAPDL